MAKLTYQRKESQEYTGRYPVRMKYRSGLWREELHGAILFFLMNKENEID